MSQDFTAKSNRELDDAVNGASSYEEMRERLLATMAKQGTIIRDRTDSSNTQVVPQAPAFDMPASESGRIRPDQMRERVLYPSGNVRLVIVGSSEEELDAQEAQIRAAFGSQR